MSTAGIGDADSDRIVRLMQEQVGAGRLTLTEFDERAARAYAAQSRDELDSLIADLPVTVPAPAAARRIRPVIPAARGLLAVALFVAGLFGAPALLAAAALCAALACHHRPVTAAASSGSSAGPVRGCCPPGHSASRRLVMRSGGGR